MDLEAKPPFCHKEEDKITLNNRNELYEKLGIEKKSDGLIIPIDPARYHHVIRDFFVYNEIRPDFFPEDYMACFRTALGGIIISYGNKLRHLHLIDLTNNRFVNLFISGEEITDMIRSVERLSENQNFVLHRNKSAGGYITDSENLDKINFDDFVDRELSRMKKEKTERREMADRAVNIFSRYSFGAPSRGFFPEDVVYSGIPVDSTKFVTFYRDGQLCDASLKGQISRYGIKLEPGCRLRFAENGSLAEAYMPGGIPVSFENRLTLCDGLYYIRERKIENVIEKDYIRFDHGILHSTNPLDVEDGYYKEEPGCFKKQFTENDKQILDGNLFKLECSAAVMHRVYSVIRSSNYRVTLDISGRSAAFPAEMVLDSGEDCITVDVKNVEFRYNINKTAIPKNFLKQDIEKYNFMLRGKDKRIIDDKIDLNDDLLLPSVYRYDFKEHLKIKSHFKNKSMKKNEYIKIAKFIRKEYVPAKGQADTVHGELIRGIYKLEEISHKNADCDESFMRMADYIKNVLLDSKCFNKSGEKIINEAIENICSRNKKSLKADPYALIMEKIVDWYILHQKPVYHKHNPAILI